MGQIADDAIDGTSCSLCGIYFVKPHGYPVVCKDCWNDLTCKEKEKKMYQRATEKELGDDDEGESGA